MTMLEQITEAFSGISYKFNIIIGFSTGVFASALSDNLNDIILTFILGASSALGAALIKYIMNKIKRKEKDRELRSFIREQIEEYNETEQ